MDLPDAQALIGAIGGVWLWYRRHVMRARRLRVEREEQFLREQAALPLNRRRPRRRPRNPRRVWSQGFLLDRQQYSQFHMLLPRLLDGIFCAFLWTFLWTQWVVGRGDSWGYVNSYFSGECCKLPNCWCKRPQGYRFWTFIEHIDIECMVFYHILSHFSTFSVGLFIWRKGNMNETIALM